MISLSFRGLLAASGAYLLGLSSAWAQQPAPRILVVSPLVGDTIDQREKRYYGLFPYFSTADFEQAHFEQSPGPDSTITLQARFLNGTIRRRVFTPAQLAQVRQSIEVRQQELAGSSAPTSGRQQLGRSYAVQLVGGASFVGKLVAERPLELEFEVTILGPRTVRRSDIRQLELLTPGQARRGWDPVGNGTRLFLAPTARNLRRGEGYVQNIDVYLLGGSYGITDNISLGALVLLPIGEDSNGSVVALTPKFTYPLSEKVHIGAGGLVSRAFGVTYGLGYGVGTYGSADHNLSAGLGYAFAGGEIANTPLLLVGGATRVLGRISLLNETYLADGSYFGLFGARLAAPRLSGSMAFGYGTATPVALVYLEAAYRFGNVK